MSYRALAGALCAAAAVQLLAFPPDDLALQLTLTLVGLAPIALLGRSIWLPVAALVVMYEGLEAADQEPEAAAWFVGLWVVAFTAGVRGRWRPFLLLCVAVATGIVLWQNPEDLPFVLGVMFAPPHVLGLVLGARRRQVAELEAAHRALAEQRARAELLAAQAERARIARDTGGLLASALRRMVDEARAAGRLVDADPDAARAAFRGLHTTGAQAAAELRRLLGLLHAT